jgi:hypothetical protein
MDRKILKWSMDLAMGSAFLISFVTGLLKFMILLRLTGLSGMILPSAFISDIHDWSGIFLGVFVFIHLFLNRQWIISMTRKVLTNERSDP